MISFVHHIKYIIYNFPMFFTLLMRWWHLKETFSKNIWNLLGWTIEGHYFSNVKEIWKSLLTIINIGKNKCRQCRFDKALHPCEDIKTEQNPGGGKDQKRKQTFKKRSTMSPQLDIYFVLWTVCTISFFFYKFDESGVLDRGKTVSGKYL